MSQKQKPTKLENRRWAAHVLRAVPHVNRSMDLQRRHDGGGLAKVPLRKPQYLVPPLSWILPYSSHRRCQLDRIGIKVLDMCNGRRSVQGIIEQFAAEHKLLFREAQIPVMQFLRQLTDRGIVAIVGLEKDANKQ